MLSAMLEMSVYTLAIIFAANILTDYISISETRLMIDLASKSLSTFKIVLIFILDLVLSIAFVLLVYFAIEVVNTVFYPDYYLNSDFYGANYFITLDQNVNIFYAVYVGLIDLFTMSPSDWDIGQRLRLVFLLSNLTTSIWLWFFLAGLSIQRIIQIPKRIRYFIAKYTVFNSKPLTISSAFLSIVLILIFSPYNALWSRSLLSYDRAIVKLNNDNYPTIIYFRNDSFHLEPVAEAALDNLALSLITNPKKIRLEGNQDPFGSREYAIAIGDRRSQSVKRYLIHKGVDQSLIDTVSYGEEMLDTSIPLYEIRPAHKNFRRVEIIYSH